jgi:LacI family transcriptional regulator
MDLGTAIVFLDRPQRNLAADSIVLDDYGGARAAVDHLVAHGHRRIALVTQSLRIYTMTERHRGYREALAVAGLEPDTGLEVCAETADEARARILSLLDAPEPPTAIFCGNNRMTVGAIGAIGEDRARIAVIGFDDLELAEALAMPLTVVCADAAELGGAGAELLLRRMGGWDGAPQAIVLPTTLVARGSGEIPPP